MVDTILRCRSCGIRFLCTDIARRQEPQGGAARLCPGCQALERLTSRHRGRVKWFTPRKGFGFVADADGGDVFVHVGDLTDPALDRLRKGQLVSYRLAQTDKGVRAVDVQLVPQDDQS